MAERVSFGDLHFPTITPDELAMMTRRSLLFGLSPAGEQERSAIAELAEQVLPLLRPPQLAVVLNAFTGQPTPAAWLPLKRQLELALAA